MSNEFKDRLARGELTNSGDYKRMKDALQEMKKEDAGGDEQSSQEWLNWDLSPVWSPSDSDKPAVEEGIRADGVQRALDRLDKN